ncbi:MAG: YHYH domain-containing protein [Nitrospinae bacterium]|nr:YHYH domain-containing protein [Nitrospinota bacterium]
MIAKRCFTILFVACFLVVTSHHAGAHGGGLDSSGCHRETATGGYHCHRGGDDGDSKETLLIVLGVVVVVGLIGWILKKQKHPLSAVQVQADQIETLWKLRF